MILTESEIESLCDLNNETVTSNIIIEPSKWYESKKILMAGGSAIPGYVSYKNTPYWEDPVNCISQFHPARDITIMGPAQDGKTFMVLEPMIGYTIECNPGNILHLTGNSDLSPDASLRVETMIHNCKIHHLIRPSTQGIVKGRTGDTAIRKEFPDGIYRVNSITKKNALRQNDIAVLIIDDTDAAKKTDAKVGNLRDTAKGRTKAFEWKCKRVYTSSPEILENSFIWESWQLSDKRLYYIPCPYCQELIHLEAEFAKDNHDKSGLYWELDEYGRVDPKTVCYICQVCGGRFDEKDKLKWMSAEYGAKWKPTCTPKELYHYGFKKSAFYAPPGMTSWYTIACGYLDCNPPGLPRLETKWQTFLNITMGEPYSPPTEAPDATDLIRKVRSYEIGIIPEAISEKDGNGDILLLLWNADCNGVLNDARIDWQVTAVSRNGATYSVDFGSFGTFIPNQSLLQKSEDRREKFSYERDVSNSVWKLVHQKLDQVFKTDTGRFMKIAVSGIDCGYLDSHIFNYIDKSQFVIFGLMGDKENAFVSQQLNLPLFKQASSRHNLFMCNVNAAKDIVANRMKLPWDMRNDSSQPHEFMNFPNYPSDRFFSHFESETRRINDKGNYMWQKKSPTSQNHQWDVFVYFVITLQLYLWKFFKKGLKEEVFNWAEYAKLCPQRKK